ncbi:helix-turn-helix transcriptional regulator [Mesorhizobium loti]|nr:helix-turn-helix transcriptional regulator [Mesorhizobium loti]
MLGSDAQGQAEAEPITIASPADLGRLVRAVRERRDFSQQAFADLAGVGRRFLSELENGKPTLELGKVLKVTSTAGIVLFARER